jgi:cell division protease FtsH
LVIWQVRPGGSRYTEISYSALNRELDRDNVSQVEIVPDAAVARGRLRSPSTIDSVSVTRFQTTLPFTDPAPLVARLEAHGVAISGARATSTWMTVLFSILPWALLIGFWFVITRQMRARGEGVMAFGRVGAKPLSPDRPQTRFDDVAGCDEAKAELSEIIAFLKNPGQFQRLGGRLPKGVLLVGPPGTGKTLLARAVAGEAGCPFFSVSGSDFVELFVGVGASRVRDLFQQGKANAPAIIFIDELDAVGRQRAVGGMTMAHDEREQTLNQLLVELDGFDPNEGVILLSATNRPDVLDPALLRPGRFDRQIVVDLPDVRGREKILQVHTRKIPLAPHVDLTLIARGTPGMAGADLANMVNEAALLAARKQKQQVDMEDLEDAKDKVMLGVERRSLVLTPEERRLTAYHEAGHAILNVLIPGLDPIHKVTIVPRGRALGITFSLPQEDRHNHTREYLLGRLAVAYGGRIAEELAFGADKITTGAAQDFAQATDLARRMVTEFGMSEALGPLSVDNRFPVGVLGRDTLQQRDVSERTAGLIDAEVRRIAGEAYQRAEELLRGKVDLLHRLAGALLERETLSREEVEMFCGRPGDESVQAKIEAHPVGAAEVGHRIARIQDAAVVQTHCW